MLSPQQSFQVLAISPGIAVGRVQPVRRKSSTGAPVRQQITPDMVPSELERIRMTIERTRSQLTSLKQAVREKLQSGDDAGIFDAHLMLLDDRTLLHEVEIRIKDQLCSADFALFDTAEHFAKVFANIPDDFLKERAADIRDVADRMMSNLNPQEPSKKDREDRRIIVASTLAPSETAALDTAQILGFAIETGSATCHTAILARSMRLPAVAGVPAEIINTLSADDKLIIDGFSGRLIVNPDARTEDSYRLRAKSAMAFYDELAQDKLLRPETTDGFEMELAINISAADEINELKITGASGVGLLRTEFLFFGRDLPGEDEQFEIYRKMLVASGDAPVTVRTMDVGGDKLDNNIFRSLEANPFLGLRGIRLCLYERRDLFETQLRALLRAGLYGNLRIMFPMVSSVLEVLEVKAFIEETQKKLAAEKVEFLRNPVLGVMIETPAAALMADELAKHVDFFSIGTNDLVQYTMAIDRGNERVAYLYKPAHPAILKLIAVCVAAARRNNIYVGVCGQMASEPEFVPLLVGLGVNELSVVPGYIPVVRRVIRSISLYEAEKIAAEAMECPNAAASLELSMALLERCVPELVSVMDKSEHREKKN